MTEQEAMQETVRKWNHTESPDFECEFTESELIGAYFWQAALQWAAEGQEPVAWMSSRNGFIGKQRTNGDYDVPLYAAPVPNADLLAEVERLRKALSVAHGHIDMTLLEVSHRKDAATILAALAKGA